MINSALTLTRNGRTLALCSTDDFNHGTPDFAGVAAQVRNSDFVLYAPHSPDALPHAFDVAAPPFFDLAVCGHTHGGQLFPWTTISKLIKVDDRVYGYERRNGTDFIVTSGISDWEIKFKTGTKSEYVIIDVE